MFKYTKASLEIIKKDLEKYQRIFIYLTLTLSIAYYVFALINDFGNFYANIILISVFSFNLFVELLMLIFKLNFSKKRVRLGLKVARFSVRAFSLGTTIYGLYLTIKNVSSITIVLVSLLTVSWLFEFILELLVNAIMPKLGLIVVALDKDVGFIKKPAKALDRTFKIIKGERVEEDVNLNVDESKVLEEYLNLNKEEALKEESKELPEIKKVKPLKRKKRR